MKRLFGFVPVVCGICILMNSPAVRAQGAQEGAPTAAKIDPASQEALLKTQQLLRDAKLREKAVGADLKAKDMDARVREFAGSDEAAQDIYSLSAELMENVVKESGGDPEKMQKLIEEAKKNPSAFAARFSPEQKAKLKAIAEKIPTQKKP